MRHSIPAAHLCPEHRLFHDNEPYLPLRLYPNGVSFQHEQQPERILFLTYDQIAVGCADQTIWFEFTHLPEASGR